MGEIADVREGINTGDNDRFLRLWHEVSWQNIGIRFASLATAKSSGHKWFPCNKGGGLRRWYGNNDYVLNWENDGFEIRNLRDDNGALLSRPQNTQYFFRQGITWSGVGSSGFGTRFFDIGHAFNSAGRCLFPQNRILFSLGLLNSSVAREFLRVIAPTLSFTVGNLSSVPVKYPLTDADCEKRERAIEEAIQVARSDWDALETSWDFDGTKVWAFGTGTIKDALDRFNRECSDRLSSMRQLEEENNRFFNGLYGLVALKSEVTIEELTLYRPDQAEDIKRLLSYAIGCTMGRYSLDKPGLIYAHSGNKNFDPSQYKSFRADDDGIIPLLETDWGIRDDATNRFVEFIGVAWPREHLEENLKFVADSLGPTGSEQSRDTIRRYLATGFYKHHLSMYKKRPIYWLFSSGKQRAFQCLVYLHRYHEGTLARMRTEYVIPLQGQIAARIEQLEGDKSKATSTSHRKKLQKEQDVLKKQQTELLTFEEKLKHAADQKISLDLDDGVKVNYAKFGDLLAESKAITGGKDDE